MGNLAAFFLATLIGFPAFAVEFKSSEEILVKLSAYKVEDINGDAEKVERKQKLKIDEMFEDLEAAAKYIGKDKISVELAFEIERVSIITFLHDPMTYSAELILDVYERNMEIFQTAAKRLHPVDSKLILGVLEGKLDTRKNGQG